MVEEIPEWDVWAQGLQLLIEHGFLKENVRFAVKGKDDKGAAQVLAFGRANLMIVDADGELVVDAGPREVRGLEVVDGMGVRVFLALRFVGDGMRPYIWDHHLDSSQARSAVDHWQKWSPYAQLGSQLPARHWHEEEYAYYAGRVITEAARAEAMLLLLLRRLWDHGFNFNSKAGVPLFFGSSGQQLAESFTKEVGEKSQAFRALGENYLQWFELRNMVTHGVRFHEPEGQLGSRLHKVIRRKNYEGEFFEQADFSFEQLVEICQAFQAISEAAFALGGPLNLTIALPVQNLDERLRDLPLPKRLHEPSAPRKGCVAATHETWQR